MDATALFSEAIANFGKDGFRHGVARHTFPDGSVLLCVIKSVAGCSQVIRHNRATWRLIPPGEQYSKPISHKRARELFKSN